MNHKRRQFSAVEVRLPQVKAAISPPQCAYRCSFRPVHFARPAVRHLALWVMLTENLASANLGLTNLALDRFHMIEKPAAKPRLSSEERKASIVEAAIRLFGERGFRGTTTRELAAAVGVREPILYEHFKTKSDLYAAIIDTCSHKGVDLLAALRDKYGEIDDDEGFFTALGELVFN